MEKSVLILVLKIVVAVASAVLAVLGANVLSSCTAYRSAESHGKTVITVVDTTYIDHKGTYNIQVK